MKDLSTVCNNFLGTLDEWTKAKKNSFLLSTEKTRLNESKTKHANLSQLAQSLQLRQEKLSCLILKKQQEKHQFTQSLLQKKHELDLKHTHVQKLRDLKFKASVRLLAEENLLKVATESHVNLNTIAQQKWSAFQHYLGLTFYNSVPNQSVFTFKLIHEKFQDMEYTLLIDISQREYKGTSCH